MRPSHTDRSAPGKNRQNLLNSGAAIENSYSAMSIDEIRSCKPKSRLESFLRRKILEKKNREILAYK